VTEAIEAHPRITVVREEITALPPQDWGPTIIATGPLTSESLAADILTATGEDELAFFDAIAPIVYKDSIDFSKAWFQSRYDKVGPGGDGKDYINLPLDEDQYNALLDAIIEGEKTDFKEWEKTTQYFDGCLPIEEMARRGRETLRFGPMKPVGLTNPHEPHRKPHAIVQLRQDNALGTLYNMVGFQTKLKYGAQGDVLRLIPGLENARFARLGGIHRNTFINSPKLLDHQLRLKSRPQFRFAGQITGVEGYLESAAIGLLTGRLAAAEALGREGSLPPRTTALGALHYHITEGHIDGGKGSFQPMNVNFGLFPPIEQPTRDADGSRIKGKEKGRARKKAMSIRALADLAEWLTSERRAA
jgi:methylenetetrahydrofolate--tRNA-(uracil-5-)-methyltransferase